MALRNIAKNLARRALHEVSSRALVKRDEGGKGSEDLFPVFQLSLFVTTLFFAVVFLTYVSI